MIYGQIHYTSGLWSDVASLALELETSPGNALSIDLDPQPGLGYEIHLPPDADWHGVFRSSASPFTGRSLSPGKTPTGFAVSGGPWSVSSSVQPACPSSQAVTRYPQLIDDFTPGPIFAGVSTSGGDCMGAGTFDIHEITFASSGDLASVSADFRLTCYADYVMSGSVRYGSDDAFVALDPTIYYAAFGELPIGGCHRTHDRGLHEHGDRPDDAWKCLHRRYRPWRLRDHIRYMFRATLATGSSCAVAVRARPTAMSYRSASLRIPDQTARGSRRVRLTIFGLQQTSISIDAQVVPAFGPGSATVVVTTTPDAAIARLASAMRPLCNGSLRSTSRAHRGTAPRIR